MVDKTRMNRMNKLKGHQIIGELRQVGFVVLVMMYLLKGHQIIGELRRLYEDL